MRTHCILCGKPLENYSHATKYCPECAKLQKKLADSNRYNKMRVSNKEERRKRNRKSRTILTVQEEESMRRILQKELNLNDCYFDLMKDIQPEKYYELINSKAQNTDTRVIKRIELVYKKENEENELRKS